MNTVTIPNNDHARTNQRRQLIAKSLIRLIQNEFDHIDWESHKCTRTILPLPWPVAPQSFVLTAPKTTIKKEYPSIDWGTVGTNKTRPRRNNMIFVRRSSKDDNTWIKDVFKDGVCTSSTTTTLVYPPRHEDSSDKKTVLDKKTAVTNLSSSTKDGTEPNDMPAQKQCESSFIRDQEYFCSSEAPYSPSPSLADITESNKSVDFGTDDAIESNFNKQQAISQPLIRLIRKEFYHLDWDRCDDENKSVVSVIGMADNNTASHGEEEANCIALSAKADDKELDTDCTISKQRAISKSLIRLIRTEFCHLDWDRFDSNKSITLKQSPNSSGSTVTSKGIVDQQRRIAISSICLTQSDFQHEDWKQPEILLQCRRVVDSPNSSMIGVTSANGYLDRSRERKLRARKRELFLEQHYKKYASLYEKQRMISKSLRGLIRREFAHIDWKHPQPVAPPHRVLDWSRRC